MPNWAILTCMASFVAGVGALVWFFPHVVLTLAFMVMALIGVAKFAEAT
jgi:hypothetical protein